MMQRKPIATNKTRNNGIQYPDKSKPTILIHQKTIKIPTKPPHQNSPVSAYDPSVSEIIMEGMRKSQQAIDDNNAYVQRLQQSKSKSISSYQKTLELTKQTQDSIQSKYFERTQISDMLLDKVKEQQNIKDLQEMVKQIAIKQDKLIEQIDGKVTSNFSQESQLPQRSLDLSAGVLHPQPNQPSISPKQLAKLYCGKQFVTKMIKRQRVQYDVQLDVLRSQMDLLLDAQERFQQTQQQQQQPVVSLYEQVHQLKENVDLLQYQQDKARVQQGQQQQKNQDADFIIVTNSLAKQELETRTRLDAVEKLLEQHDGHFYEIQESIQQIDSLFDQFEEKIQELAQQVNPDELPVVFDAREQLAVSNQSSLKSSQCQDQKIVEHVMAQDESQTGYSQSKAQNSLADSKGARSADSSLKNSQIMSLPAQVAEMKEQLATLLGTQTNQKAMIDQQIQPIIERLDGGEERQTALEAAVDRFMKQQQLNAKQIQDDLETVIGMISAEAQPQVVGSLATSQQFNQQYESLRGEVQAMQVQFAELNEKSAKCGEAHQLCDLVAQVAGNYAELQLVVAEQEARINQALQNIGEEKKIRLLANNNMVKAKIDELEELHSKNSQVLNDFKREILEKINTNNKINGQQITIVQDQMKELSQGMKSNNLDTSMFQSMQDKITNMNNKMNQLSIDLFEVKEGQNQKFATNLELIQQLQNQINLQYDQQSKQKMLADNTRNIQQLEQQELILSSLANCNKEIDNLKMFLKQSDSKINVKSVQQLSDLVSLKLDEMEQQLQQLANKLEQTITQEEFKNLSEAIMKEKSDQLMQKLAALNTEFQELKTLRNTNTQSAAGTDQVNLEMLTTDALETKLAEFAELFVLKSEYQQRIEFILQQTNEANAQLTRQLNSQLEQMVTSVNLLAENESSSSDQAAKLEGRTTIVHDSAPDLMETMSQIMERNSIRSNTNSVINEALLRNTQAALGEHVAKLSSDFQKLQHIQEETGAIMNILNEKTENMSQQINNYQQFGLRIKQLEAQVNEINTQLLELSENMNFTVGYVLKAKEEKQKIATISLFENTIMQDKVVDEV